MKSPLTYAISSGEATDTEFGNACQRIVAQAEMLAAHNVTYFQIREKLLSASNLHNISAEVSRVLSGTSTRLLLNDRADIAASVGAFGVHLASSSLPSDVVRICFGERLAIVVSTHTEDDIRSASNADALVFGPIFASPGKTISVGLLKLKQVVEHNREIPIIALGGIDETNCRDAIEAGAAGVAGIRAFTDADSTSKIMTALNKYA